MAEYGNLSGTIGGMKRAAIDCWMADQGFIPHYGNDKLYAKWGWMLNFYNRPDANGNGGGDGNGVNHSVAAQFEEIRGAVDSSVSRWLDLPDGAACDTPRKDAGTTAAILGISGASASVQNSGEIATSNNTVHEVVINQIRGSFKSPFLDKYYTQFSKVSHGLGDACVILEANYIAEFKMWPAVQDDVATICEAALQAWKAKVDGVSTASGTFALTVVAAVAGAVASVVTAGTGTVAAVAILGSVAAIANSAVQGIAASAAVTGTSYGEILGSLNTALGKLNDVLKQQEKALQTMMTDATGAMRGDLASFNLDAYSLGDYPTGDGTMSMDKSDTSIVSTNMNRIELALADAAAALRSAPSANPTPRSAGIGLGASGTHGAASELWSVTARCLELTTAEYSHGHELFNATVDDFFNADNAASDKVAALLANEALSQELGV